ncbi:MAG: response regulator [Pseudobdellovibrionaceae bacterium]
MSELRTILAIEDSPEDFEVLARALRKAEMQARIIHKTDGESGLAALAQGVQATESDERILPDMILLDLNLPATDGFGVLERLKIDARFSSIPVIVLSTSSNPTDIRKAYKLGANSYISKPQDLKGYIEMAGILKEYWVSCVQLPPQEHMYV